MLDHNDMKNMVAGRPLGKGGLGRRLLSGLGAVLLRYFYRPSLIRWMLKFSFPFRKRVVILGGVFAGCELGVTLVERGKRVAIIEESKRIGYDVGLVHRWVWLRQLRDAGARLETESRVLEIADEGVRISKGDSTELVEADTVVIASGLQPNTELIERVTAQGLVVYSIGDCAEPGRLQEAMASCFLVGQRV